MKKSGTIDYSLPEGVSLNVLNIGTAVLVKDVMEQHLRTIGDIRTYYAASLRMALQTYTDRQIHVIFCELSFDGGTAQEFVRRLGGLDITDNVYFVVCTAEDIDYANALGSEIGADSILKTPFSTNHIIEEVKKALEKKARTVEPWMDELTDAKLALKNLRHNEAKRIFNSLLKDYDSNIFVHLEAAKFYLSQQEFDKAELSVLRVLEKDSKNLIARSIYAKVLIFRGSVQSGIETLERCQEDSPLNSTRASDLIEAYITLGLQKIRQALDVSPANPPVIVHYLKSLAYLKKYDQVVKTYDRYEKYITEDIEREAKIYVTLAKKLGDLR